MSDKGVRRPHPHNPADREGIVNVSPDTNEVGKAPQSSETLTQAVPPSPASNHSLGSLLDDDISRIHTREDSGDSDLELDEVEDTELDVQDFYAQHIADMAAQVSLVLADIVAKNDRVPFSSEKLTRFHSRAPPGISIRDYIIRIIKFCNLDKAVLLVLLFLVDLFTNCYANFVLNSLTVHRFLITACTVAAKGLCDQFCSNTHYAKVGGVSVMELNLLEVEFLTRVQYRIIPDRAVLPKYYARIKSKRSLVDSANTSSTTQHQSRYLQEVATRKHARDEASYSATTSASDSETTEMKAQAKQKSSGNKGFNKAVRETLKFLQPSKKKRGETSGV